MNRKIRLIVLALAIFPCAAPLAALHADPPTTRTPTTMPVETSRFLVRRMV
jgi:hypothetical protein